MPSRYRSTVLTVLLVAASTATAGAQTPTLPFDHVHLNVPVPADAAAWYETHMGGTRITEAPDRLIFGSTRLGFMAKPDAAPSQGSAVDHIGFSFPDLDAKMKEFEAAGIKIVSPIRDVAGLFKLAFIEDPWGTRIEVVQDEELLGLHHIHMRGPNPEEVLTWLVDKFGGTRQKLKGRNEAVRFDVEGFSGLWFLVQSGEATPTQGRAIDHIGWRSTGPLAATIDGLRAKQVTVTGEPQGMTMPNGAPINYAYVDGPSGVRIEMVERPAPK